LLLRKRKVGKKAKRERKGTPKNEAPIPLYMTLTSSSSRKGGGKKKKREEIELWVEKTRRGEKARRSCSSTPPITRFLYERVKGKRREKKRGKNGKKRKKKERATLSAGLYTIQLPCNRGRGKRKKRNSVCLRGIHWVEREEKLRSGVDQHYSHPLTNR